MIEDVINNYNYYYKMGTEDSTELTLEMRMKLKAAEACLELREFAQAQKKFERLSKQIPQDYRVWWGQIRALTKEFSSTVGNKAEILRLCGLYDSMMHFVPAQRCDEIRQQFLSYIQSQDQRLERHILDLHARQEELEKEYSELQSSIRECQEKTYPNSEEQLQVLQVILVAALVFGIFGNAVILLFALAGIGLFYMVLIPWMKRHADQWEQERQQLIADSSQRSLQVKQELKQIEEELCGLA